MAQNQAYLLLVFTLTGVVIGLLFDFFRILRKSIKTPNFATYIEDILFWILTGFIILYNIWYFNDGEIRIYMFLGIIIGVLIYMSTLSKPIIYIFSKILIFIINLLKIPFQAFFYIIIKISTIISPIFINFTKKFTHKKGKIEINGE